MPLGASFFEDEPLVDFIYLVFARTPGGVTVGDSGLCLGFRSLVCRYKPEILSRIAQTTAALTKLKPVWNDRSISLSSKIRLMRSLVTSSPCTLVNH